MSHKGIGLLLVTAAVLVVAQFGATTALAATTSSTQQSRYVANQILVTLRDGRTQADLAGFNAEYGSSVVRRLSSGNIYLLSLPAGRAPLTFVGQYTNAIIQKYPVIQAIQLNHRYTVSAAPSSDPFYTAYYDTQNRVRGQWPLQPDPIEPTIQHVHAPEAWDLQKGSSDVVVAVIDTGVRTFTVRDATGGIIARPHPDLANRLITNPPYVTFTLNGTTYAIPPDTAMWDFDPAPDGTDEAAGIASHGTEVSGIIAAQGDNGIGISGICWNGVRILPVKIAYDDGSLDDVAIYEALEYIIRYRDTELTSGGQPLRVNVANMSFGSNDAVTGIMLNQYQRAAASGIILVSSAGNDWEYGAYAPGYPAALDEVICVGSTNFRDVVSSYSQRGRALDIVAPGEDVVSTAWSASLMANNPDDQTGGGGGGGGSEDPPFTPPGSYTQGIGVQAVDTLPDAQGNYIAEFISGTSFSSPLVAGACALLLSHGVPASDVKDILCSTATPIGYGRPNDTYGWGLLNMRKALEKASIDVQVKSPAKSSIVTSARPRFRIEFRHALRSSIQVWLDRGTPGEVQIINPAGGSLQNWETYYTTLDSAGAKTYLEFDYPVSPGNHTITAMAQTDMNLSEVLTAEATTNFTVRPETLVNGWHMFSVPYDLADDLLPEALIGTTTQLWRYAYADGVTGTYAAYSATGRRDLESTFQPPSVIGMNLVHPQDGAVSTSPAGLGYWLKVRSSSMALPSLDTQTATQLPSSPYYIGLYTGWNMVGCPFTVATPWASVIFDFGGLQYSAQEAVQMGLVSNYIYSYDALRQTYTTAPMSTAVMQPWKAQWVRVKTAAEAPQTSSIYNPSFQGSFGAASATNCSGYVGSNWSAFSTSGNAYFGIGSTGVSDGTSQRIAPAGAIPGYFNAGICQQVSVVPGTRYAFSAMTKRLKNCTGVVGACRWPIGEGTQIGIDPTGGLDPLGDTVVWSPTVEGLVGDWSQQVVYAQAQSSLITVFVRVLANAPGLDQAVMIDNAKISNGHDLTLIVNPG